MITRSGINTGFTRANNAVNTQSKVSFKELSKAEKLAAKIKWQAKEGERLLDMAVPGYSTDPRPALLDLLAAFSLFSQAEQNREKLAAMDEQPAEEK